MESARVNLVGMLPEAIFDFIAPIGEPPYRARQLFRWVHRLGVTDFNAMTNIPKPLRAWLCERAEVRVLEPKEVLRSVDGSMKLVFEVEGGTVSAVLMPSDDRNTLCVSVQIGCRMRCAFCLTGQMGFVRDLVVAEIVGQVLAASKLLPEGQRITNVVFMGMGEPLDNLAEVVKAVKVITHREGLRVAPSKTTISTVGLIPKMREFAMAGTRASLAVSLCATTDDVRQRLVPIAKRYRLSELIKTLRDLAPGHGRRHTIEYVMIAGVGDTLEDAKRLSKILSAFPSKVNLIPFNPWPGTSFQAPSEETINTFCAYLASKGHVVTVRRSRGRDIGAACGQLRG